MESMYSMTLQDEVLNIRLSGRLDHTNAPAALDELKQILENPIKCVIINAHDLEYIASSGLRVLIFSKKKIGEKVNVHLVGAQEEVLDVIQMTGLDNFLIIQETFESK